MVDKMGKKVNAFRKLHHNCSDHSTNCT